MEINSNLNTYIKYSHTIHSCQENIDLLSKGFLYHDLTMGKQSDIAIFAREARSSLCVTQDQLAEILGCTKGNVSAWENGRHEPAYQMLLKLSRMSGVALPGAGLVYVDDADMELIAMIKNVKKAYQKRTDRLQKASLMQLLNFPRNNIIVRTETETAKIIQLNEFCKIDDCKCKSTK